VKTLHQDEDAEAPVSTHSDEQRSQPCEAMSMSLQEAKWREGTSFQSQN
jgi:hypothetical protein